MKITCTRCGKEVKVEAVLFNATFGWNAPYLTHEGPGNKAEMIVSGRLCSPCGVAVMADLDPHGWEVDDEKE